jgi:hypothetical protein
MKTSLNWRPTILHEKFMDRCGPVSAYGVDEVFALVRLTKASIRAASESKTRDFRVELKSLVF